MRLRQMNSQVRAELARYPRGRRASAQNVYRAIYQMLRMHSLGAKSTIPDSAAVVCQFALRLASQEFPGFVPLER